MFFRLLENVICDHCGRSNILQNVPCVGTRMLPSLIPITPEILAERYFEIMQQKVQTETAITAWLKQAPALADLPLVVQQHHESSIAPETQALSALNGDEVEIPDALLVVMAGASGQVEDMPMFTGIRGMPVQVRLSVLAKPHRDSTHGYDQKTIQSWWQVILGELWKTEDIKVFAGPKPDGVADERTWGPFTLYEFTEREAITEDSAEFGDRYEEVVHFNAVVGAHDH